MVKDSHCSYCGNRFGDDAPWPRRCLYCGNSTYRNPLPVAVVLLPMSEGVIVVRRNIEPRKGTLTLPGGVYRLRRNLAGGGAEGTPGRDRHRNRQERPHSLRCSERAGQHPGDDGSGQRDAPCITEAVHLKGDSGGDPHRRADRVGLSPPYRDGEKVFRGKGECNPSKPPLIRGGLKASPPDKGGVRGVCICPTV